MKSEEILKAMHWRYAGKIFDPTKKVSEEDLHAILEAGRLAPSSVGIEPWKFIVVKNTELRQKMRAAAYDQPKVTDATYIIVIAHRKDATMLITELLERTAKTQGKTLEELDGLKQMAEGSIAGRPNPAILQGWLAAQTYISLGIMVETAALLEIDSGPMEGFDPVQINEILGLDAKNLHATTMLAIGYRGEDPHAALPKVRRSFEEAVEIVE